MQENKKITTNKLRTRTTSQRVLNQEFFFWFRSSGFLKKPVSLKYWLLRPFFYKEATCKSSTVKGLLYAAKAVPSKDTLRTWPWKMQERDAEWSAPNIMHHIHGASVLLGMQLLKDMTSLGTDFETHAIWQGYVEDPTMKDFVARKARTIVMSKVHGSCHETSNNQRYSQVWKFPWGFHTQAVLRSFARTRSHKKVSVWGF